MRKMLITLLSVVFLSQSVLVIYAKSDKSNSVSSNANSNASSNQRGGNSTTDSDDETDDDDLSPSELAKTKSSAAKIKKVKEIIDDPEIEEEVDELAEDQEDVEEEAEEDLMVGDRPAAVKLLIGPDYKNLGQLRSEVVRTRNNIRRLERVQEKIGAEDSLAVETALMEMRETAYRIQAEIYTKLSDFSLFGWIFRWMSGFEVLDEVEDLTPTPVVSDEPTVTGSADTEETVTPSPTETPVPTETEEAEPTTTTIPTEE